MSLVYLVEPVQSFWKESKIIPQPKMDGIIFKQILNDFSRNGLLTSAQYGYRPCNSTITTLVLIMDQWLFYMDDRKLVGAVF